MRNNTDITSSIILIVIVLIISGLVYYLFFYSGSRPQSPPQEQKMDQGISPVPLPPPDTSNKKRKDDKEPSQKKDKKIFTDKDRESYLKKDERPFTDRDSETQENTQALDLIRTDMDNLVAFINQRSMQQFFQEMVSGFEIREGGDKLIIYVANTWYYLPPVQKRVMCELIGKRYGMQTCMYKIRTECSTNDFPTIIFLNHENREVVRMGANNLFQIYE